MGKECINVHTYVRGNIEHKEVIVCMNDVNNERGSNKFLQFKFEYYDPGILTSRCKRQSIEKMKR